MIGDLNGVDGSRAPQAGVIQFQNLIWDQLFDAGGDLQFCVRWESAKSVTSTQRDQIEAALQKWANGWFSNLIGYDCWPYQSIPVKVVGWATNNPGLLGWNSSDMPIYTDVDSGGVPQCPESCGRFFNRDNNYSGCTGGEANHYDMSLWLTDDFYGGVGGDWGQRLSPESFMGNMNSESNTIWQHEFGHGLGFPDYYNWNSWYPNVAAPTCIMNAGAAHNVTDWDQWMLKRVWSELQSRLL
jgi:hypothetical protein